MSSGRLRPPVAAMTARCPVTTWLYSLSHREQDPPTAPPSSSLVSEGKKNQIQWIANVCGPIQMMHVSGPTCSLFGEVGEKTYGML